MVTRRSLLASAALGAVALPGCRNAALTPGQSAAPPLPPLFDDIEERTFRFFWDTTNPANGLAVDRWPSAGFASIAAVGFALTAYPIGVARGWITREQARERTLATVRFFWNAPQGPDANGVTGHKGFFYHFLDMQTGLRFGRTELSTVDTALLMGGMLFAAGWFASDHPDEREIRSLTERIYARIEWPWFQHRGASIAMGWHPETGIIPHDWRGYNEGMLVYVLALGSPTHPVAPDAWAAWTASYGRSWRGEGPTRHLGFAPHFGHQYSHGWIDFRGIRDAVMAAEGFDYFENSRRATYYQRAYATANPMRWDGYSSEIWGLTACDGPADVKRVFKGEERTFRTYSARGPVAGPDGFDDGTIAPTAAIASIAFAPEIVIPATLAMHRLHGERIYSRYGFLDSFNPSFRWTDIPLHHGTVDPVHGWVDGEYLGIDQGPILTMIANHRDDFVWKVMRASLPIRRGLERAGFTGGWLSA